MEGAPTSRYVAEEELTLGHLERIRASRPDPPSNPFRDDGSEDDSYDSEGYVNGDDAFAGEADGRKKRGNVELWKDDLRSNHRNGNAFEMVPLSEGEREFNCDDDDESDRHVRIRGQHAPVPFSGDDYESSGTMLPKRVYHYLYPPDVPRAVQLCRPENLAVPACYLLVGLLQGLSIRSANLCENALPSLACPLGRATFICGGEVAGTVAGASSFADVEASNFRARAPN